MRGFLATLAWQALPVPLALLEVSEPSALLVRVVLLAPLVLWALLVLKDPKGRAARWAR